MVIDQGLEFKARASHLLQKYDYDYTGVDYKDPDEPVEILCKQHGHFTVKPTMHLRGSICPECYKEKHK